MRFFVTCWAYFRFCSLSSQTNYRTVSELNAEWWVLEFFSSTTLSMRVTRENDSRISFRYMFLNVMTGVITVYIFSSERCLLKDGFVREHVNITIIIIFFMSMSNFRDLLIKILENFYSFIFEALQNCQTHPSKNNTEMLLTWENN